MPEVSNDAAILIATSWQALQRSLNSNHVTQLCDRTIVILFAGFFVEANLNEIIERLNLKQKMQKFLGPHPGLQDKLAWFYNQFATRQKASNRSQLFKMGIKRKIRRRFPGFAELYRFRNDISHGIINRTAQSQPKTLKLRKQAKDIVELLFDITRKAGNNILRDTTYWKAIASQKK